MREKPASPFCPGSPVPEDLFVGRFNEREMLVRYAQQALSGKQENVFLMGEKGIGKTSLASFLRHYLSASKNFVSLHVFLGGVSTLEGMVHRIFERLLNETRGQSWFQEIRNLFGKHIKEVGLFGISISFAPPEEDLKKLVEFFPEALLNLLKQLEGKKNGLLIVLDDINGLAETKEFANWYKSFVDEVATHFPWYPVCMMLNGVPQLCDRLYEYQASLMRIFRLVQIDRLSDSEVEEFFKKAFKKVEITVKPEATRHLARYSSGLPLLMQEIGDATYWEDQDGVIDELDAGAGIIAAAESVGKKYLDPLVYRAIRSERYRAILDKLAGMNAPREFQIREVGESLNSGEKRVFHNFLRKMQELKVIESAVEKERGTYRFVNDIYPLYIILESRRRKKR
jgi:hypothetical protein